MRYTTKVLTGAAALTNTMGALAGLATTTHYSDGLQGACGCGNNAGTFDWQYGITSGVYTAAASQALFDGGGMEHWCGSGCGKCYRLTSTGVSSCETCGDGGEGGKSITVMVTNLCPFVGNEQWCPQPGQLNPHGYGNHFDIMGGAGVFGDNVVVEFEETACPGDAGLKWKTCECHPDIKGKELTDGGVHEGGAGVIGPGQAAVISVLGAAAPAETKVSEPAPVAAEQGKPAGGNVVPDAFVTVAKPVETSAPAGGEQVKPAV